MTFDMTEFANQLGADMMNAQALSVIPPSADDRAAADLSAERYQRSLAALYEAAMLGLQEADLRHLCAECGVTYADLESYVPAILRLNKQKEDTTDNDMQLPF